MKKRKRGGLGVAMVEKWPSPLEALVLHGILQEGSAYGLELVEKLDLKRGSVYVLLQRLEEKGLVFSQSETNPDPKVNKHRRYYWATPHGQKFFEALKALG